MSPVHLLQQPHCRCVEAHDEDVRARSARLTSVPADGLGRSRGRSEGRIRPGRARGGARPRASPEGDRLPRPPASPEPADLGGRRPQVDRGGRPARDRPVLLLDPHPAAAGHGRGLPRLQPMGGRCHEAVPGPRARLLLRQPRPYARGARGGPSLRRGSRVHRRQALQRVPMHRPGRLPRRRAGDRATHPDPAPRGPQPLLRRRAAPHLRRRPSRRALPALSRGDADLRRHLRRRRLGVDDPGPPQCARGVAGPQRERDGRRRRRAGGPGPRRRPAPVRLRHVDDRVRRPAPRGGPGPGRSPEGPRREHGAAARSRRR